MDVLGFDTTGMAEHGDDLAGEAWVFSDEKGWGLSGNERNIWGFERIQCRGEFGE